MTKDEMLVAIKHKQATCTARLRILYATFNKLEISIADEQEQELCEEVLQKQEYLQLLKDRQDIIGGAGHNRYCPCCGLKLPRGYFKKLVEEVKEQEQKVEKIEHEYNMLATNREHNADNALTEEIGSLEKELEELEILEMEAKDAGLI